MPKHPHEILLDELRAEYKSILDHSPQAIYVYLDNEHKLCNEKFAAMLGYKSAHEWEILPDPMVDLEEPSIQTVVNAYQSAAQSKMASTLQAKWKKRGGGSVNTSIIMVPIAFKGELLALHFITAK